MGPRDLAAMFLRKARQDAVAAVRLAAQPDVADEIVGFQAQQAIEKHVKAVLVSRAVPFRRTHDLVDFFDTAHDAGLTIPDWLEDARSLNPYAVEYRYRAVEPGLDVARS